MTYTVPVKLIKHHGAWVECGVSNQKVKEITLIPGVLQALVKGEGNSHYVIQGP